MQKVRLREVKHVARGHTESQSHVLDLNSKGLVFVIQVLKHIRGVNPGSNQPLSSEFSSLGCKQNQKYLQGEILDLMRSPRNHFHLPSPIPKCHFNLFHPTAVIHVWITA